MSNQNCHLITEVISRQEVTEFLGVVESALSHMTLDQISDVYLCVKRRRALAISFDSEWHAFLGYSRGYNSREDRTQFRSGGHVLSLVRSKLRERHYKIAGGRVFFSTKRVFHVNEDLTEHDLCMWIWLSNTCDPVEDVLHLLEQVRYTVFINLGLTRIAFL